jgi:HK97 gp10 family phage protein
VQIKVEGLAELAKALKALPPEISGKNGGPLRKAIGRAAVVIRDDARRRAPVDTGNLRDNIIAARRRKSPPGTEGYYIEVRRKRRKYANTRANRRKGRAGMSYETMGEAYYGMFVELGTEKELGTARMQAQPFLRPAFESKKVEAVETFRVEFAKAIDAAAKKVRGR